MKNRILLSVAAAAVMTLSMGAAAPKPAEAGVHIYIGTPGYNHCRWKRVKARVWSNYHHHYIWVWKKRRVCW